MTKYNIFKIISLTSYGFSSISTIIKLFLLSYLFQINDYISYSVLFSSSVLLSTTFFEWVRSTSARLEPINQHSGNEGLRIQIWSLFAFTLAIIFIGLSIFYISGFISYQYTILIGISIFISASGDLILTIFRARDYNIQFAALQFLRALASSSLAIATAYYSHDPLLTFLAFNLGACFAIGVFCIFHITAFRILRYLDLTLFRFALQYGIPSAVSVGFFLLIPNVLRWTIALYPQGSEALSMIVLIDFLQRPYFIAVGSVQAMMFPRLVMSFESKSDLELRARLRNAFRTNLAIISTITLTGLLTIPLLINYYPKLRVAAEMHDQYVYVLILFAAQSFIQHSGGIIPSLERSVWKFAALSVVEALVITSILGYAIWYLDLENIIRVIAFTVVGFAILTAGWIQTEMSTITNRRAFNSTS
jgi:hypothetical protein